MEAIIRADRRDSLIDGEATLETRQTMDRFLAAQERRAFHIALAATGGSREDALDLVQEAMTKLVAKYSRRPEAEWGPLFHRILQTTIRDWYRRQKVRNLWRHWFRGHEEEGREDPLEQAPDRPAAGPDHEAERDAAMEALQEAIRELPLRQQQALMLRLLEGLDVAETAAAMGCSQGSVKTHYSRAVHALRNKLGEHWS
ncbi:MAG TPA: RNA polymerase sigma factor [Thiotrichales bacterium]|nr:RNA polymerase sigma factor [Thiotrichales bacterium]